MRYSAKWRRCMHELGVLLHAVRTVDRLAEQNRVKRVKYITLEVGQDSGFVSMYLTKLFPVSIEGFPRMQKAELKLNLVPGEGLQIKDFGY